jgi:cation transport ATPase
MTHWEPQPEGLNQIITLLKQSQSTDNQIQRNVQMVSHTTTRVALQLDLDLYAATATTTTSITNSLSLSLSLVLCAFVEIRGIK